MPFINNLNYIPTWFLQNGHFQTILPHYLRRLEIPNYKRERLILRDGDFLDLDFLPGGNRRLAIISHGLEGSSKRHYMVGMVNACLANGWDALAWNMRGCSGETNKLLRSYHSGESTDLLEVIQHVCIKASYDQIALIGFSLGGNITLKLLGEQASALPSSVVAAVTFSVPCDLEASAYCLEKKSNLFYMRYFMKSLRRKILDKYKRFPSDLCLKDLDKMRTFFEFDDKYTGPLHGFKGANDYWEKSSSRQFIPEIKIPSLLISAADDPFLVESCFPIVEAKASKYFHFELTQRGGHVGFVDTIWPMSSWIEKRCFEFLGSTVFD